MLDQVIYTRCSKHRDITNHGVEVTQDGFAVYSMSESLFLNYDTKDINFIVDRLKMPNASEERGKQGLIKSYEYYILPSGKKMILQAQGRPFCRERRKNGSGHRPGTHLSQAYVGDFSGYIFGKFYSSDWNADKKTETEYYHDEQGETVPYLNALNRDLLNGGLTIERIRQFIADGRQEIYQAALRFLIQEFSKEENERKVLLIKDLPENVEMWVAGLSLAFSEKLAEKLTFSTNKPRLGTQIENLLFYYTDSEGKVYSNKGQNPNLKRHPYCMIVGYHPLDNFSKSVKQFPNSSYIILDGEKNQIGFDGGLEGQEIYYYYASKLGKDIRYFCNVILDNFFVEEISKKIPELFAAYKYLLAEDVVPIKWEYAKVYDYLQVINSFERSKSIDIIDVLFTNIINVYSKIFHEDEVNGYQLLKQLREYAVMLGKEKCIEKALADKVYLAVMAIDQKDMVSHIWQSLHTEGMDIFWGSILESVFKDDNLPVYTKKIPNSSEEAADVVLEMYLHLVDLGKISYKELTSNETKYYFLYQLVKKMKENEIFLAKLINRINKAIPLLANLTYSIVAASGSSEVYLYTLIKEYPQICTLADRIACYPNANFDVIESILKTYVMVKKSCDRQVVDVYYKAYDKIRPNDNNGCGIFEVWLKVLDSKEIGMFCGEVYASGLSVAKKEDLFERMDNILRFDEVIMLDDENINAISSVAQKMDVYSRTEEVYRLNRSLGRMKSVSQIAESIENFVKACVVFRDIELNSQFMKEMMEKAAFPKDERLHFFGISAFVFEDSVSREKYMREYIKAALSCIKKNEIPNQILALCGTINLDSGLISDRKRAEQAKRALNEQLVAGILPFYKSSFMEQMKKSECDPVVKKKAMLVLKEADEKTPKGIGGFINNIMGKRKKQ